MIKNYISIPSFINNITFSSQKSCIPKNFSLDRKIYFVSCAIFTALVITTIGVIKYCQYKSLNKKPLKDIVITPGTQDLELLITKGNPVSDSSKGQEQMSSLDKDQQPNKEKSTNDKFVSSPSPVVYKPAKISAKNNENILSEEFEAAQTLQNDFNIKNVQNRLGPRAYEPNFSLEAKLALAKKAGKELTTINLTGTSITQEQLQELIHHCPNLQHIDLSNCLKLTNSCLKILPTTLVTLRIGKLKGLQDKDLQNLPSFLENLSIEVASALTNQFIPYLPIGLKYLNLKMCNKITSLNDLPEKLEELSISNCLSLNDASFIKLPSTLQTLKLSFCNITDAMFTALPKDLVSLKIYHHQITDQIIENLPKKLQKFYADELQPEHLKQLPNDIKELTIRLFKITAEAINNLPENLEVLQLYWPISMEDGAFKVLPPHMKKLLFEDWKLPGINAEELKSLHQNLNVEFVK